MEQADFCDHFNVHTRWIETEFSVEIPPAKRQIPSANHQLTRTFIEIDGKRCELGLPAQLMSGLTANSVSPTNMIPPNGELQAASNPDVVNAPISGVLFNWLIPQGDNVVEGDVIGVIWKR